MAPLTFADLRTLLFARSNFGMKLGLPRMQAALTLLGDPHRCAKVLHVAGTNGKGSTCAFAAAGLQAAGLRVGLYTSPHLVHFCERIRIEGEPLAEDRAALLLGQILERVPWALEGGPLGRGDGDGLTFFELTTLLAFVAFAEARVDAMVIEVGLGGRLDATNVVAPLACAITALGLEHRQWLGDTLGLIAAEKAGIVKPGAPLVSAAQPDEAALVLEQTAASAGVALWRPGRDYFWEASDDRAFSYQGPRWTVRTQAPLALAGQFQRGNAALACALLEAAAGQGLEVGPEHAAAGCVSARWPGRLQTIGAAPLLLVDGAHNPHAARALASSLPALLAGRPLQLVFGALDDKDASAMLGVLLPLCAAAHFCPPPSPRARSPQALAELARALAPAVPSSEYASLAEALPAARAAAGAAGAVLCCGSLYLVGEALQLASGIFSVSMPAEKL